MGRLDMHQSLEGEQDLEFPSPPASRACPPNASPEKSTRSPRVPGRLSPRPNASPEKSPRSPCQFPRTRTDPIKPPESDPDSGADNHDSKGKDPGSSAEE